MGWQDMQTRTSILVLLLAGPALAANSASRTIEPDAYVPGSPVTVQIAITTDAVVSAVGLEEAPPEGWTISSISNGGTWDARNKKVKWGIFFAGSIPATVSYQATPPAEATATGAFAGSISCDGVSQAIEGESSVDIQGVIVAPIDDETIPTGAEYVGPTPQLLHGDPNEAEWSLVEGPTGMEIDPLTGVVTWPTPTTSGSPFSVTIRATTSEGSDDESWQITVLAPPIIAPIPNQTLPGGEPLYSGPRPYLIQGSEPITWSLIDYPDGMDIDPLTGVVTWESPTTTGSPHTITIVAANGVGSDEETWQLTVSEAPIIEDIADANIPEGVPYTGPTPVLSRSTPPVTWSLMTGPSDMEIDEASGVVTWPNPRGATAPYQVTIKATDTKGSDTETWLLTVSPSYTATVQTDVTTATAGTPVYLYGLATNLDTGDPEPNVPVTIRVRVQGTRRVITTWTSSEGNFGAYFNPLAGEAGQYEVGADHPSVATDRTDDTFILYGMQIAPPQVSVTIIPGQLPETEQVDLKNLGDTPLTGITTSLEGVVANLSVQVNTPDSIPTFGTTWLRYTVMAEDASIEQSSFTIRVTCDQGSEATLTVHVRVLPIVPHLVASPSSLKAAALRGDQTVVGFEVTNDGGEGSGDVHVNVPVSPWISLVTPETMSSLAPGESAEVSLRLSPDPNVPIGDYTGTIVAHCDGDSVTVPFTFNVVSDRKGDLRVEAVDEFTYYATGSPRVAGATVTVKDPNDGSQVASGVTDADGIVLFEDLTEAYYNLEVTEPNHGGFETLVLVPADDTKHVTAFLPRELVRYNWTVIPTEVEDVYEITVETVFETHVPAPVVTIDPAFVDLTQVGCETYINFEIKNHGLIAANDVRMYFSDNNSRYEVTPLVEEIGDLPADSNAVVPVRIRDKACPSPEQSESMRMAVLRASSEQEADGDDYDECASPSLGATYTIDCNGPVENRLPVGTRIPPADCGGSVSYGGSSSSGYGGPSPDSGGGPAVVHHVPIPTQPIDCCKSCCPRDGDYWKWNWPILPTVLEGWEVDFSNWPWEEGFLNTWAGSHCYHYAWNEPYPPGRQPGDRANPPRPIGAPTCEEVTKSAVADGLVSLGNPKNPGVPNPLEDPAYTDPCTEKCLIALYVREPPQKWGFHWLRRNRDGTWSSKWGTGGLAVRQVNPNPLGEPYQPHDSWVPGYPSDSFCGYFYRECSKAPGSAESSEGVPPVGPRSAQAEFTGLRAMVAGYSAAPLPEWNITDVQSIALIRSLLDQASAAQADRLPRVASVLGYHGIILRRGSDVADFPDVVLAWDAQIWTADDTVAAGYDDVVGLEGLLQQWAAEAGYGSYLNDPCAVEFQQASDPPVLAGICAHVRIQIHQQAVISRSGFRATLELQNTSTDPLEEVIVALDIRDASNVASDNRFGVYPPELTGISDVSGGGSVPGGSTAQAVWTIVPKDEAAPQEAKRYYVGGTLSYTFQGDEITVPLFPAEITVLPNPELELSYYLERVVYSDDPFTTAVEQAVPFSLGLLMRNTGPGTAKNVRITSGQPKIVENEKGLLIDFLIIGTKVGSQSLSPSMSVNLGDLGPSQTNVAQWIMTASLQGEFVDYDATVKHINPLGDEELSLIDPNNLTIHGMTHVVRVDEPNDDGLPDFLVNDTPDSEDLPEEIHSSDGSVLPVTVVTDADVSEITDSDGTREFELTMTPQTGWTYLRIGDPSGEGGYRLVQVTRSDGRQVRVSDNAWTTHRVIRLEGQSPEREDLLHLVDYEGTGSYRLVFEPVTQWEVSVEVPSPSLGAVGISYLPGNQVVLTATPEPNVGVFGAWLGVPQERQQDNPLMLTLGSDVSLTAIFAPVEGIDPNGVRWRTPDGEWQTCGSGASMPMVVIALGIWVMVFRFTRRGR